MKIVKIINYKFSSQQLKLKLVLFSYFLLGINWSVLAQINEYDKPAPNLKSQDMSPKYISPNHFNANSSDATNNSKGSNSDKGPNQNTQVINEDNSSNLDTIISYSAKDSIIINDNTKEIYLYGQAIVEYKKFKIEAGYIKIDAENNLITAMGYKKDAASNLYTDRPILKDDLEEAAADTIVYNYKTEKGKLWKSFSKQDNAYLSSNQLKLFSKNEAFIKDVVYTTCNIPDHPHFGFHITKAKMTDDIIIAGPVYPEILGIPIPIVLPFGIFPKTTKRQSGIILPKPGEDSIKGFFLNDFGYYFAFNDYIDLIATASIYSNGSLGTHLNSRYKKLYKYDGNLDLNFSRQIQGERNTDTYTQSDDYRLRWRHAPINLGQESSFSSNMDIGTSTYFTNNVNNIGINDRVNSTLNSSVSYSKNWKYTPYSMSVSFTHYQNLQTRDINLSLPNLNFNVAKFYPFRNINQNTSLSVWYKKISATYSASYNNQINTKDYLLFSPGWQDELKMGVQHRIPISADLKIFKYFNFTPNINYTQTWYEKTIEYKYNQDKMALDTLWNHGLKISHNYTAGTSINTTIYGIKEFGGNSIIKAIRHVINPSIRYSFSPSGKQYYREYAYTMGDQIITRYYSIFENSLYSGLSRFASNVISADISNNLEIKVPSKTDSLGYKKIPILENLSFSSGYDFTADTAKLQNFNMNGRTTLFKAVSINFSGSWDPYIYQQRADGYYENTNRLRFDENLWPELRNFNFSVSTSLNKTLFNTEGQSTRNHLTAEQIQMLRIIDTHPEDFIDFNVPWDLSINYSYNYNKTPGRTAVTTQTLNFSGNITVTTNFSVRFTSGYDFKNKDIAPTQLGISRDLHCWSLSIDWVPFGYYKSYFITLRANASALRDLKITKQQPYYINEVYN